MESLLIVVCCQMKLTLSSPQANQRAVLTSVTAWLGLLSSRSSFDAVPVRHTNSTFPFIRLQRSIKDDWGDLHGSQSEHIQLLGSEPHAGLVLQVRAGLPSSCQSEFLN